MSSKFQIPKPTEELISRVSEVKIASNDLLKSDTEIRNKALFSMAKSLEDCREEILNANSIDLTNARNNGLAPALIARLKLNESKFFDCVEGIKKVAELDDPVGKILVKRVIADGLILEKTTVPLGVIGVIFEARPDAAIQIASLAIKSGNGAILKGGSEASFTNKKIISALRKGLYNSNISKKCITLLTSREESLAILSLQKYIEGTSINALLSTQLSSKN